MTGEKKESPQIFNKEIQQEDKWEIFSELSATYNKGLENKNPFYWEKFAIEAKYTRLILPNDEIPLLNNKSYKGVDEVSKRYLEKGDVARHINIDVAKKILFPEEWSRRWKDFHSDEIRWRYLTKTLQSFETDRNWNNLFESFTFAQNMKILAPRRFESLNLQKILGPNVWVEDIKDELEFSKKEHYANFTLLATPIQILGYPARIVLEQQELEEMEKQGQELKKEDIMFFAEFTSRRNILSAKEIKITDETFDLIF